MEQEIKVAIIGLDTSHSVEFTRRMQGDNCPTGEAVSGLRAVSCLQFATPFQNEEGLEKRRRQLEEWGVKVTTDFETAVADCDAIMIEINDPSRHWEYLERCAVFLDKPLADNIRNGRKIADLASQKGLRFFSSSPLRYDSGVVAAADKMPCPKAATVWGPLGIAPAGSSIVWYGVHVFEILQLVMGKGAAALQVINNADGAVAHVDYIDGRHAVVEMIVDVWRYGGVLRDYRNPEVGFSAVGNYYGELLRQVEKFFRTGEIPLAVGNTLEVMGMLDAAARSAASGRNEAIYC